MHFTTTAPHRGLLQGQHAPLPSTLALGDHSRVQISS